MRSHLLHASQTVFGVQVTGNGVHIILNREIIRLNCFVAKITQDDTYFTEKKGIGFGEKSIHL